jgi:hypothetical protein
VLRCAARPVVRRKIPVRRFSAHTANAAPTSAPSPLGAITVELDRIAPRFEIPASQITILDSPANFYSTLKVRYSTAAMVGLQNNICAEQNPQCQAARLPLHTLHWQDRVRVDRDPIGGSAHQPRPQSIHPYRRASWYPRNTQSFNRVVALFVGAGIWARTSRDSDVPYPQFDGVEEGVDTSSNQ